MKIGILIASIGEFGQKGFYNVQEIGLAKALDALFDQVTIYKGIPHNQTYFSEPIDNCKNTSIKLIPCRRIGTNGFIKPRYLDTDIDILIYLSDTQLLVPKIYKWSKMNKVRLLPYIGVLESHSTNSIKRMVIDTLMNRNFTVYRKCHCLVKTPDVESKLRSKKVNNVTICPVGLDLNLLKDDYLNYNIEELKDRYGYLNNEKIILFIGRMTHEKQPIRMVEIFKTLYEKDNSYRLLFIGKGELKEQVLEKIEKGNLSHAVKLIDQIPNADIWELYRIADTFVNLNEQEIFGMAILEAMYYECKVVALKAPGPNFIIEDGISGYLANSDEEILRKIKLELVDIKAIHNRIADNFTWEYTARVISQITKRKT